MDIERESEIKKIEEEKIEYLLLKERVKSSENLPNGEIKRKSPVLHKIMSRNYYTKLSREIIS